MYAHRCMCPCALECVRWCGMKITSGPTACPNATRGPMSLSCSSCAFLFFRSSDCHPRICARNSSDSPGGALDALPSVCRIRTSSTRYTMFTPSWCMLSLLIASTPFLLFPSNASGECSSLLPPRLGVEFVETSHTSHCSCLLTLCAPTYVTLPTCSDVSYLAPRKSDLHVA